VLLEFDAVAEGPATRVHRSVELRDVPHGEYVLSVTISNPATGAALTRSSRFQLVARP